ncbi:BN159_2729 family protein [Streptomyces sp. NPDC001156]
MTTSPESCTDIQQQLTDQLCQLAREFLADLDAQGRLVETGGAGVLKRLREQVETRGSLSDGYKVAVDVIESECGFPSAVALRVATALRRHGLISDREEEPEAHHESAPNPEPPTSMPRGAIVLPRPSRDTPHAASALPQPTVVPLSDLAPTIRPTSAQTTGTQEQRAADWDLAEARAITTAAKLQAENADRLEVMQIAPDRNRVTIAIRAMALGDWEYWLGAIGAPLNVPTRRAGWAQIASGQIDGVDIHLTAHGVPRLLDQAAESAEEPFCLGGRIYDLARGQVDRHGQVWLYLGQCQEGDMPLLTLCGTSGPVYPLSSIVMANGPLTPAEAEAVPVATRDTGGEQ